MLRGKKIILGITGCIAAYKSAELLRSLKKSGADVWVVMTKNATEFITPLTFRTLSGNPCITEMFDPSVTSMAMPHISLSESADLVLIVPATANIIGKASYGIADDVLSTILLSSKCKKIIAPAMNTKMWENAIVQENVKKLAKNGYKFIMPGSGDLACGDIGSGRLADVKNIFDEVVNEIGTKQDLAGKRILITAGGTREAIDPVRFIGNRSSGKMGYSLADASMRRGAQVTLITTIGPKNNSNGINSIFVENAKDMKAAVEKEFPKNDILIMAAAVADFRPASTSAGKIKKSDGMPEIKLEQTDDILKSISGNKGKRTIVGFSVESKDIIKNSSAKLKEKGLDMIVANPVWALNNDENEAVVIKKDGRKIKLPKSDKTVIANKILDQIIDD